MTRLLALMFIGALAGCGFADADQSPAAKPASGAAATATRVEVATLTPSQARIDISLPGEVEGWRDALLASAMGGRVEAVEVANGDAVRNGRVLLRVDSEIHSAQLDQARAQLAQAEADLARFATLGDMASEADRDRAATQVKVAGAGVRLAAAQLDQAVIRAPFDGVISSLRAEVGEFAAPGSPVLRLAQLDPVKVTLAVPDRDVVALRDGMEVSVTASARAGQFPGTVRHIGTAADLDSRAFPVEVEVPNPDGLLLPGMIVRVVASRVVEDGVVVIPQEWVVNTLEAQGVFLDVDGVATWRPVVLGDVVRSQVVVTSGLQPGDRVVMVGQRELAPGDALFVNREGTCCEAGRAVFGDDGAAGGAGR